MENYIKIPKDFESLNDLSDLLNNFELTSKLQNSLNDYQNHYIKSKLMSIDEVLNYIPLKKQKDFTVNYRKSIIHTYLDEENYEIVTLKNLESLRTINQKAFFVDTINKKVDLCGWFEIINSFSERYTSSVKYTLRNKFIVDSTKRILIVKTPYTFNDRYPVGGVMINKGLAGQNLRGHKMMDYEREGEDEYYFCLKTNKYLGNKIETFESMPRKWFKP